MLFNEACVPYFRLLVCDFCGGAQGRRSYPTESSGQEWYACALCVRFINNEDWDNLTDRIIAAFTAVQQIPAHEQTEFRQHLAKAFQHSVYEEYGEPLGYTRFATLGQY
jgi:hypothetical protein